MPLPKARIPKQVQLLLTFVGGALAMLVWHSVSTTGTLNANLTEAQLDARANGVIATQKKEINRLRRELQTQCGTEEIQDSVTTTHTAINCTTHLDCPGWTSICKNTVCTELVNPACACQSNDTNSYILCIANQGAGPDARNISCGNKRCSNDPKPHCVNE